MPEPTGKAVFLSYASQDAEAVLRIAEALRAAGVEVWFDKDELVGGDAWDTKIKRQIQSCALFIPVISANTQEREEGYFRREWNLAANRTLDMAHDKAFLLPVVIDQTSDAAAKVPEKFREVQWTRLPGGDTSVAFVSRVQHLLGGTPFAAPAAKPMISAPITAVPAAKPGLSPSVAIGLGGVVLALVAYFGLRPTTKEFPAAAAASPAVVTKPAAPTLVPAPAPTAVNDKSLVVLPLENLSPDPENAFFTDGMHAEIIATLQRALPELTVISRNSALAFKDSKMSLAEIAQKLGVANVIVGSVRRADGRVRIQLELRRASDEATLWVSPKAERELKDVFAIQSEVAEEVARVLQIRGSKGSFGGARFTTKEPRAFDLFLKARALRDADYDPRDRASRLVNMEAGIRLAEEAMKLDAGFASAAGLLANLHELAINTGGGSPESRHLHALECKRWADEAARLMSGGAGEYGLAVYYANVERDYARALRFAQNTLQALPNDADAHNFVAICFGGLGRIEEALSAYRRAIDLDPLVKLYWGNALGAAARLRRQEEFASLFERSGASNPMQNSRALHGRYMLKGELRSVNDPQEPAERVAWLWRGRKFGEAMTVVETELARPDLAALTRFSFLGSRCDLLRRLGRDVEATDTGREMLVLAEKLQSMVETGPSQKLGYSAAALVRAARMDEAIATARLYVGAASPTERATIRWTREITLAETYAHFSRSRECVELIAKLLRVPSGLTVPMLKVDPVWDNVREDAAFKALLADPKNSAPL